MEHRTAIVTGAARRVGRALSEALLADGWRVVAQVRDVVDDVAEGATKVAADLSTGDCAVRILDAAGDGVALLVNCAARFAPDSLKEPDGEEMLAHMAVNVRAPALLVAELARRHGGGEAMVINILDAKLDAPNPDYLSYTLSKYALAGLTEVAARGLAAQGIRVNAVAPALMLPSGEQDRAAFDKVHALNPLGYGVAVDDLVGAVRFLVEQKGVTGQTLTLDGGQRFLALPRDVAYLDEEGND